MTVKRTLHQPDPERVRAFVVECAPDAPPAAVEQVVRFLCVYSALPAEKQYLLAHRIVLREPLEQVARGFREVFRRGLTAAGVAASLKAVLTVLEAANALPDLQH